MKVNVKTTGYVIGVDCDGLPIVVNYYTERAIGYLIGDDCADLPVDYY